MIRKAEAVIYTITGRSEGARRIASAKEVYLNTAFCWYIFLLRIDKGFLCVALDSKIGAVLAAFCHTGLLAD